MICQRFRCVVGDVRVSATRSGVTNDKSERER